VNTLENRFPSMLVQVRGKDEDTNKGSGVISRDQMIKAGIRIQEQIKQLTNIMNTYQGDNRCVGNPELWIFEHLTDPMKERATCIRDWCEERLELMSRRIEMRFVPALGVGSSKQILRYAVDILKACENELLEPLLYFVVYVGAYCYHLGMILSENEEMCWNNYSNHGRHTWQFIMGESSSSIVSAWQEMGFSSQLEAMLIANVCAGCQKNSEGEFEEVSNTQAIYLDGRTMHVSPVVLSKVLKLADIISCDPRRLPDYSCMQQYSVPEKLIYEYLKHEIIQKVNIDNRGMINIELRQCFRYPSSYRNIGTTITNDLENEIGQIVESLNHWGIKLPSPKINQVKSLFLDQHPYWGRQK